MALAVVCFAVTGCGGGSDDTTRSSTGDDDSSPTGDDDTGTSPDDDYDDDSDDDSDDDVVDDDDDSGDDDSDDNSFSNEPPVLDPIGPHSTTEGELLEFAVTAADADGDELSFSAVNLPPGAEFDEGSATFSWTPASGQDGSWPGVRFLVTDGHDVDEESITINVGDDNFAPLLNSIGPQSVDEGELLVIVLTAADPDGDAVSFTADPVPLGAAFFPSYGVFLWTPNQNQGGNYTVRFDATDGAASAHEDVEITVNAINVAPRRIQTLNDVGFDEDSTAEDILDYDLFFEDPDGDHLTYTFEGEAPVTLSVDGQNQLDASAPENYNGNVIDVVVTATDPDGLTATGVFDIHVNPVNDAPSITSIPGTTAAVGASYRYDVTVSDVDVGDHFNYQILQGPAGASINGSNGRLTWTPQIQHWGIENHFLIKVSDNGGAEDQQEWFVSVGASTIQGHVYDVFSGDPISGEIIALVDRNTGQALRNVLSDSQGYYEIPYYPSDVFNSDLEFAIENTAYWHSRRALPAVAEGEYTVDQPLVPTTYQNQQKILEKSIAVCDLDGDGQSAAGDCPVFPIPYTFQAGITDTSQITAVLQRLEQLAGETLFTPAGTPQTGGLYFTRDPGCGSFTYQGNGVVCFSSVAPTQADAVRGVSGFFGYREETEIHDDLDLNNAWELGAFTYEDANLVLLIRALVEDGYTENYDFLSSLWTLEGDDGVFTLEDVAGSSQGVVNGSYPDYEIRGRLVVKGVLVILPGTHIRMNFAIEVTGGISALGTAEEPIIVEGLRDEPGAFGKISLDQTRQTPSVFQYVIFKNGTIGLNLFGTHDPFPVIENCDFRGTRAGIAVWDETPDATAIITNSLFVSGGTGIWWSSGGAEIVNSVFYDNMESIYLGECVATTGRNSISYLNDKTVEGDACAQFLYSDLLDTVSAPGGTGSVSVNPDFMSASDFRLKPQSVLINAGDPDAIYNDPNSTRNDMGIFGGPSARE